MQTMTRSCRISLKFITELKRKKIRNLIKEYRRVTNLYIKSLWKNRGPLNKETLERVSKTTLSQRYKSQALRQALSAVVSTRKALKSTKKYTNKIPHFSGNPTLDAKFIAIEDGNKSFDLSIKLSTLQKGKRIILPARKTAVLNKWLAFENSVLVQGGVLYEDKIIVFVKTPMITKASGKVLGIDLGVNKLLTTSDGVFLGADFKNVRDKILRKTPKSKAKARALKERDNLVNRELNKLPWSEIKTLVIEDLAGIKTGKTKNRSRSFRRNLAPWTVAKVITRIEHKAEENRVCLQKVDPRNTSKTCPVCKKVASESRKGEQFHCIACGHRNDADVVGAINVLQRFVGNVEFPVHKKDILY